MLLWDNGFVHNILATGLARNLLDGSSELLASSKNVVECGENHDGQEDRRSVVHVLTSDRQERRERQEDDEEHAKRHRKDVDRKAEFSHCPWSESDRVRDVVAPDGE